MRTEENKKNNNVRLDQVKERRKKRKGGKMRQQNRERIQKGMIRKWRRQNNITKSEILLRVKQMLHISYIYPKKKIPSLTYISEQK